METTLSTLYTLLMIAGLLIALVMWASSKTRVEKVFSQVAQTLKLTLKPGSGTGYASVSGQLGAISVSIKRVRESKNASYIVINMQYKPLPVGKFKLGKETFFSGFKKIFVNEMPIGDPAFDERILSIANDQQVLLVLLDPKLRTRILDISYKMHLYTLTHTRYEGKFYEHKLGDGCWLPGVIRNMCQVVEDAAHKQDPCTCLLANLEQEKVPGVRINLVRALGPWYGKNVVKQRLRHLLQDPFLHLEAALALGKQGLPTLHTLLEEMVAGKQRTDPATAEAILNRLAISQYKKAIPLLQRCFTAWQEGDVRETLLPHLLEACHILGDPAFHPLLLPMLDNCPPSLKVPVLSALETCGTLDAVEPIYNLGKSIFNPGLRNAAQQAIAAIQERCGSGDSGWLSLEDLEPLDGALSEQNSAGHGGLSKVKKKGS